MSGFNNNLKERTFNILEYTSTTYKVGMLFNVFMVSLISLNIVAVIIETIPSIYFKLSYFFKVFEIISVIIFTVEYLLRLWCCNVNPKYKHPILGRIRYSFTFLALVDLLAILPFYLPMLIAFDLRFLRALRLFRFLRLLKLGRYSDSLRILGYVFKIKKGELFICFFVVVILLVLSSSLIYFFEHSAQPEDFSSIPATMWWGVATLTTVGYGDICPITPFGRFFGAIIALLGIGMVALPTGVIASGFAEEIKKRNKNKCPHCGKEI